MKLKFIHINTYKHVINVNPHVHNVCELVYYINAKGYSHYGRAASFNTARSLAFTDAAHDDVFYFENNSYILFPPGTVHDERHQTCCKLVAVGFDAGDFPLDDKPLFGKDADFSVLRLVEKITAEYRSQHILYNKLIEAALTEILVGICRSRNVQTNRADPIKYARTYINEYFTTDINLEELAASTGYSLAHFRELFKSQTGTSPKSYILNKREKFAKTLLSTTRLPFKEVAGLCGFSDYSQFNKFFNARTGMNPKEYRASPKNV